MTVNLPGTKGVVEGVSNTSASQTVIRQLRGKASEHHIVEALFTQHVLHLANDTIKKHAAPHQHRPTDNHKSFTRSRVAARIRETD